MSVLVVFVLGVAVGILLGLFLSGIVRANAVVNAYRTNSSVVPLRGPDLIPAPRAAVAGIERPVTSA